MVCSEFWCENTGHVSQRHGGLRPLFLMPLSSTPPLLTSLSAMSAGVSPYTGRAYSARYKTILAQRQKLPVWEHRETFLSMLQANRTMVLEGETGSGKTTQVGLFFFSLLPA